VISQRNTDIGALITAGSTAGTGSTQTELFHIVQPDILRVYVNVPERYSQQARPGLAAELALAEFPGRTFTGKLVRTADAIDPITRTLMVEIQVKNTTGTLFTGSYAEVHLKLQSPHDVYLVPVETLLFRSTGLHVAAVTNGQVLIKTITPGHDFGDHIEVVAGLNGDETVIVNPSDSIATGNKVNVATQPGAQTVPAAGGAK